MILTSRRALELMNDSRRSRAKHVTCPRRHTRTRVPPLDGANVGQVPTRGENVNLAFLFHHFFSDYELGI